VSSSERVCVQRTQTGVVVLRIRRATIRVVSRRDLVRLLNALWRLSNGVPEAGVSVADLDEAIGRGHGDMRTPLNLQSLAGDGHARRLPDGTWALTPEGVAWLKEDRELSP
jgi:hypothetical protein